MNKIRVMRIKYWGHIQRREKGHPLKIAEKLVFKKRKRGRPAKTWNDSVKEDIGKLGIGITEFKELAKDKENYRKQYSRPTQKIKKN